MAVLLWSEGVLEGVTNIQSATGDLRGRTTKTIKWVVVESTAGEISDGGTRVVFVPRVVFVGGPQRQSSGWWLSRQRAKSVMAGRG